MGRVSFLSPTERIAVAALLTFLALGCLRQRVQAGQVVSPHDHREGFRVADNFIVHVLLRQRVQSLAAKLALQPESAVARRTLNGHVVAQIGAVHGQAVVANAAVGLAVGRRDIRQTRQCAAEVELDCLPLDCAHPGQFLYTDAVIEIVEVVGRRDELQCRVLRHRADGQHGRARKCRRPPVASIVEALDDARLRGVILEAPVWGSERRVTGYLLDADGPASVVALLVGGVHDQQQGIIGSLGVHVKIHCHERGFVRIVQLQNQRRRNRLGSYLLCWPLMSPQMPAVGRPDVLKLTAPETMKESVLAPQVPFIGGASENSSKLSLNWQTGHLL